jgi:hypothetical protein
MEEQAWARNLRLPVACHGLAALFSSDRRRGGDETTGACRLLCVRANIVLGPAHRTEVRGLSGRPRRPKICL